MLVWLLGPTKVENVGLCGLTAVGAMSNPTTSVAPALAKVTRS